MIHVMSGQHEHRWEDAIVACDDCGEHAAIRCADPDCDRHYKPIDLVRYDDPLARGHRQEAWRAP
jgi:hypothetical protein